MFFVNDSRDERNNKIRSLIDTDICIAVLVAAADFEWTCRRCILALGCSPTKHIRENVLKGATFTQYPRKWNIEVYPRFSIHIDAILPHGFLFNKDNEAFELRNKIIHGECGFVKFDYGKEKVEEILLASNKLTEFAKNQYDPIYGRRIMRTKAR
jgi:hypothetical protein